LISIDGHSAAWKRPNTILASNSVLFKTTTKYYQWFADGLIPWVNYIPIRPDFLDLIGKINWARSNDHLVQQISKNGRKFADLAFSKDAI